MKVAIHQPNFFPWLGYFDKILNNDAFVVLDHVVVNVKNPNWLKKVSFSNNGQQAAIAIPVIKGEKGSFQSINDIEIDRKNVLWSKNYKSLVQMYAKHSFYSEVSPMIEEFFAGEESLLFKKNMEFIMSVISNMGLEANIHYSSELNVQGSSNEMLIQLVKQVGGNTYVSGGGADSYQKPELFEEAGVNLEYQNFVSPEYAQKGVKNFIPGLSLLDCLANIGFEETKKLLK